MSPALASGFFTPSATGEAQWKCAGEVFYMSENVFTSVRLGIRLYQTRYILIFNKIYFVLSVFLVLFHGFLEDYQEALAGTTNSFSYY